MTARLLATLVACLTLASGSARAQAPAERLALEVGKGQMVHLDAPATGVFIGDPAIADVLIRSPTLVYVMGKGLGQTTLMAVDSHETTLANIEIDVGYELGQLRRDLKKLTPEGDIEVSMVKNAIVLSGTVPSVGAAQTARDLASRYAPDADHVINLLKVDGPNQINLRVRIVEVSRDIIKALGVTWAGAAGNGQFSFGVSTGIQGIASTATNLKGLNTVLAGIHTGGVDLNALIDALDSNGLATVLAEPNLTAASGASANFLAGGEYPVPVPQGQNQVTIEYKKYGVSLDSVATITDDGRIRLTVRPEVSQLTNTGSVTINGITVPALTTRRAETTVDMASGQSFAIAGLLQNNVTHDIQKFPGLGDIAVLGQLFRSDRFERKETELVIIVTPYLVRPSSRRLPTPVDGYVAPTDLNRLLSGADHTPVAPPRGPGETRRTVGAPQS
jgi:pilus assembly protein CpaC